MHAVALGGQPDDVSDCALECIVLIFGNIVEGLTGGEQPIVDPIFLAGQGQSRDSHGLMRRFHEVAGNGTQKVPETHGERR